MNCDQLERQISNVNLCPSDGEGQKGHRIVEKTSRGGAESNSSSDISVSLTSVSDTNRVEDQQDFTKWKNNSKIRDQRERKGITLNRLEKTETCSFDMQDSIGPNCTQRSHSCDEINDCQTIERTTKRRNSVMCGAEYSLKKLYGCNKVNYNRTSNINLKRVVSLSRDVESKLLQLNEKTKLQGLTEMVVAALDIMEQDDQLNEVDNKTAPEEGLDEGVDEHLHHQGLPGPPEHERISVHGASVSRQKFQEEKSKSNKNRSVAFSTVHVRVHERILGDNPSCCSFGPSISIGWKHRDLPNMEIDDWEKMRKEMLHPRPVQRLILTSSERLEMAKTIGCSKRDIKENIRAIKRVQQQRYRSSVGGVRLSFPSKRMTDVFSRQRTRYK